MDSMFLDRAKLFIDRFGWPLERNPVGHEFDQYDDENSSYMIAQTKNSNHLSSIRIRDVSHPNITMNHFGHLAFRLPIDRKSAFEVSRYCIGELGYKHAIGLSFLMLVETIRYCCSYDYDGWIGVFDEKALKIYNKLCCVPSTVVYEDGANGRVFAGYWSVSHMNEQQGGSIQQLLPPRDSEVNFRESA